MSRKRLPAYKPRAIPMSQFSLSVTCVPSNPGIQRSGVGDGSWPKNAIAASYHTAQRIQHTVYNTTHKKALKILILKAF